jgi:pyruvate/2-oxoglutarate dehydrogenase complex dihydrolipoamide dehydrogenase (E3) component
VSDYDLAVVGGGTGGLGAAREAARRGAKTLLVQEGRLGGDCTFTGCVPSKSLLAAAGRGESFADDPKGFVRTDDTMATSVPTIWAVGDVAGKLQLTHAANRMAVVAVRNALSRLSTVEKQRFDASSVPWATFTTPEVGRVGMTEAEAAELGGRVAYLPMTEVDRAVATGETSGFLKLIAGPDHSFATLGAVDFWERRPSPASAASSSTRGGARHAHPHVDRAPGTDGTHLPVVVDGGPEGHGAVLHRDRRPPSHTGLGRA